MRVPKSHDFGYVDFVVRKSGTALFKEAPVRAVMERNSHTRYR